ncbi:Gp19/Gp15/Gp42 family protein [Rhodococcus zopfii]|uniref:Gp19/Gp15/Gp42 family protein n=1 Tax=Rhodococcus zopfii TaxID=43772 RepID=UPI000934BAF1|nr:Gp19/Gp15/Gp42 family protein [Rhodococcus zopfii]
MAAFATHEDLSKRWKGFDAADAAMADQLLADAAVWLRVWVPQASALAATNTDLAEALVIVSCAMVKRALLNGDNEGQSSSQETIGPFQYQVAFRNPEGNLFLYQKELDLLEKLCGLNTSGAVSMTARGL